LYDGNINFVAYKPNWRCEIIRDITGYKQNTHNTSKNRGTASGIEYLRKGNCGNFLNRVQRRINKSPIFEQ